MVNLFVDRNHSHLFQYIVSTTILAVEKIFLWRLKCNSMKYNCFVPKEKKKIKSGGLGARWEDKAGILF